MTGLVARLIFAVLICTVVGAPARAADLVYSPLAPCRVIDTRAAGGKFAPGQTRSYVLRGPARNYSVYGGNPAGCGIPDLSPGSRRRNLARAVVVNIAAVNPEAAGNLRAWPANRPAPATSVINYVGLSALGVGNNNVVITPAQYECTFFNNIASSQQGTARILCIDVL